VKGNGLECPLEYLWGNAVTAPRNELDWRDMSKLNWAILGTGAIAKTFAKGLKVTDTGQLKAVGSRSQSTADSFCSEYGGMGFSSYESAIDRPEVDAVYIALPHHMHAEYTIKCAQHGKHILCEKPFALNALEAERAMAAVRGADVFFMEAWMYRSHPQTAKIQELVSGGAIGKPLAAHASFGYRARRDWDHFKADGRVGGGGLLDVGAYPVSFLRMIAGEEPNRCEYSCEFSDTGADSVGFGLLQFPSGFRATFGCAIHLTMANEATIFGEEGRIHVPEPWFCRGPILLIKDGKTEEVPFDSVPDLWGHQAKVMQDHLEVRESPTMSWDDTMGNMRTLDALRRSAGLTFAQEPTE